MGSQRVKQNVKQGPAGDIGREPTAPTQFLNKGAPAPLNEMSGGSRPLVIKRSICYTDPTTSVEVQRRNIEEVLRPHLWLNSAEPREVTSFPALYARVAVVFA